MSVNKGTTVFKITMNVSDFVFDSDIVPTVDNSFDIGSSSKGIAELHLATEFLIKQIASTGDNTVGFRNSGDTGYQPIDVLDIFIRGLKCISGSTGDHFQLGNLASFPRIINVTTAERNAIAAPVNGMIVYNETTHTFDVRINGAWEQMAVV